MLLHTKGDDISAPGYWTDVRVREGLLPSLAGLIPSFFGKVNPSRKTALAPGSRSAPRSAAPVPPARDSGQRHHQGPGSLLDQCTGNEIAKADLAQLPENTYDDYQNGGGGSLWAVKIPGSNPPEGDPSRTVDLPLGV